MTDDELMKILRISDEPLSLYSADRIADLRAALEKHICVKAIPGDSMSGVDYFSVDSEDCELCKALEEKP